MVTKSDGLNVEHVSLSISDPTILLSMAESAPGMIQRLNAEENRFRKTSNGHSTGSAGDPT